ncbi:FAD-NAD(P)-binding-domain-containing protein [Annulohypoxylon maeteangense]|uniref:FAD-NAD(P)-binding-domain-containing protein n=1 Tax=Annulohypoxylon maeteangense TaxID=1927788 RepID=UPI0020073F8A|nr:FAD-NAD(P)-binding-domain-containing protein [Annulohypoxylon maeteangense]KAI0887470.1 FAD-NAD(P)-binding-domain-containing protein [Annulohypoxylon maeteangense]
MALHTPLGMGLAKNLARYSSTTSTKPTAAIAVIGNGPLGTIVLGRICELARGLRSKGELTVHVIDSTHPGSGTVWHSKQPKPLLMNTKACQMTVFNNSTVSSKLNSLTPNLEQWAAREGYTLSNGYAPRYVYGRYLTWCLQEMIRNAPRQVKYQSHIARAISLDDEKGGLQKVSLDTGVKLTGLSAVILTQGHLPQLPTAEQYRHITYAQQHPGLRYIPPANPAYIDLSSLKPGEKVLLRGLGLIFFDYMILLTQGRGGRFDRDKEGNLHYTASGNEPHIIAGSRRGIPYRARGDQSDGSYNNYQPLLLTSSLITSLRNRANSKDAPNFSSEVLPLIKKEVETTYYETLLGKSQSSRLDFRSRYLHSHDPSHILSDAKIPKEDRWSWDYMSHPYLKHSFHSTTDWKTWLLAYLHSDIEQARGSTGAKPVHTALDVLRGLRPAIRQIVDHGGLSGASRRDDLERGYTPLNSFLSVGPPRERIEQLIALIKAGIVTVIGPGLEVIARDGGWEASSVSVPGSAERVTALIEARMAEPDVRRSADELLGSMWEKGQCRAHCSGGYETGGLDVTRSPFHLINREGVSQRRRFALGVPTEGVHWVTTAGPGENVTTFLEAEEMSRAVLDVVDGDMAGATGAGVN